MGMYDNVNLELTTPLPEFEGDPALVEWQTKDIHHDPCLDTYIIKGNRLVKICHEWEEVPMGERVNIMGLNVPLIRPKKTWEEDTEYHGKFNFYTNIDTKDKDGKEIQIWYEYIAKFTDGELVNISIVAKNSEYSHSIVLPPEKDIILTHEYGKRD